MQFQKALVQRQEADRATYEKNLHDSQQDIMNFDQVIRELKKEAEAKFDAKGQEIKQLKRALDTERARATGASTRLRCTLAELDEKIVAYRALEETNTSVKDTLKGHENTIKQLLDQVSLEQANTKAAQEQSQALQISSVEDQNRIRQLETDLGKEKAAREALQAAAIPIFSQLEEKIDIASHVTKQDFERQLKIANQTNQENHNHQMQAMEENQIALVQVLASAEAHANQVIEENVELVIAANQMEAVQTRAYTGNAVENVKELVVGKAKSGIQERINSFRLSLESMENKKQE
jgi:hypothetical protein